jgi:predicted phosphodiesterase
VNIDLDRIAVISDIHGNMTALEAVLNDIGARGINRIYCLGDIAGKGPSSVEAVDTTRSLCETVVKGNWDYIITEGLRGEYPEMLKWHVNVLGQERLAYLKGLPLYAEFYFSGRLLRLCHASPDDLFFRVFAWTANDLRRRLFFPTRPSDKEADAVGYGDIHKAYIDSFDGKILFNVGSVGNPLDITQATYAIIEGDYGSLEITPFAITLVRVPYDIEIEIQKANEANMPGLKEYVEELKTAVYRGDKK